jgi:hypothetical protein
MYKIVSYIHPSYNLHSKTALVFIFSHTPTKHELRTAAPLRNGKHPCNKILVAAEEHGPVQLGELLVAPAKQIVAPVRS